MAVVGDAGGVDQPGLDGGVAGDGPAAVERLAQDDVVDLLGIEPVARSFASLGPAGRLQPGLTLPAPQGVFPRYVDPEEAAAKAAGAAPKQPKKGAKQDQP